MKASISITDRQLRSLFSGLERPTAPIMRAIASYLADEARVAIKTETSPNGKKFAALSPKYAARKAKDKRTRRTGILQQSGQLFDGIAADSTDDTATIKTNRPVSGGYDLGAIHHFGAPRSNIPARPFFPITPQGELLPEALAEIKALVIDYFFN